MFYQLSGIAEGEKSDADINRSYLRLLTDLVHKKSGISDRLVICGGCDGGMDSLDLKKVIGSEDPGNIFGNLLSGYFVDDKKIDPVTVLSKDIFGHKVQQVGIIAQFNLYGTDGSFMPVDMVTGFGGRALRDKRGAGCMCHRSAFRQKKQQEYCLETEDA